MILYFSASGNSRFIAESAADHLQDECVCLNDRIKNQDFREIFSDTPFVLVCPIFAWRVSISARDRQWSFENGLWGKTGIIIRESSRKEKF